MFYFAQSYPYNFFRTLKYLLNFKSSKEGKGNQFNARVQIASLRNINWDYRNVLNDKVTRYLQYSNGSCSNSA